MFSMSGQPKKMAVKTDAILPGATIGCLGGGQLGRMFMNKTRDDGNEDGEGQPQMAFADCR